MELRSGIAYLQTFVMPLISLILPTIQRERGFTAVRCGDANGVISGKSQNSEEETR